MTVYCCRCGRSASTVGDVLACVGCGWMVFDTAPPLRLRLDVDLVPPPPRGFTRVGESFLRSLTDATDEELLMLLDRYRRMVEAQLAKGRS